MVYGYGVLMTPLQTLAFYNAIANNGVMVKPRFIEKIESFGQSPDQTFGKIILNPSICSQSTIDKVKKDDVQCGRQEIGNCSQHQR